MAYTTTVAIEAKVPGPVLTDALDDDGDGQRDAGLLDAIVQNASDAVDAMICNRMLCPIGNPPASIRNAALWFAVEEIYGRRQRDLPKNFEKAIATARQWLEAIRDGKQILDASVPTVLQAASGGFPQVPGRLNQGLAAAVGVRTGLDGSLMMWNADMGRWCRVVMKGEPPTLAWDVEGEANG